MPPTPPPPAGGYTTCLLRGWAVAGFRPRPRRTRPPARGAARCAEYVFFATTGAYSPHARAGDAWADIRLLVDASVREAMDTFLVGLLWDADPADDPALQAAEGSSRRPPTAGS